MGHRIDMTRIPGYGRFESGTLKMMGLVELFFALALIFPTIIALHYGEDTAPFTLLIPILMVLGGVQLFLFRQSSSFRNANGMLVVAAAWAFVFFVGMVPYVMAGMNPFDAVFESVSGFTTTGGTMLTDIESWPKSILIWRSLTQWIGGIAVIIIFMYILPYLGVGRAILSNELSGSGANHFSLKMEKAAKSFILVYSFFSLIHLLILLLCRVDPFDALCLMFTTISTGGLMCTNNSLMGYSDVVQFITIVFMFLGGVNFYLHYRAIYYRDSSVHDLKNVRKSRGFYDFIVRDRRKKIEAMLPKRMKVYTSNSEFRFNLLWFVVTSIICTIVILATTDMSGGFFHNLYQTFKNVLFTVVSLGTTTGYYVTDYTQWPEFVVALLFLIALFGASAGSTSGGIKLYRLRIAYGFLVNAVTRTLHPNAVYSVKTDNISIDQSQVLSALSIIMMYIITMILGALIVMLYGYSIVDSFGLTVSAVANGGLGFGMFGPTGSMGAIPDSLKLILSFLMWLGRLEILVALVFLTPSFWKEIWLNRRTKHRLKKESRDYSEPQYVGDSAKSHGLIGVFSVLRRRK